MEIYFNEYDKYSIEGKIVDINDRTSTLTISVTSPFVNEVKFYCNSDHYDRFHPPKFTYSWISWVGDVEHPVVWEAAAYYNTNDKCFYKKESGSESEWERADFKDIYEDNPNLLTNSMDMQEKYQSFLYKYKSILHKEQLCRFSAYVIKRTDTKFHSVRGQEVERHPNDYDYTWIYDPDSFYGEKWDAESIDGLVKEILPSRECLEELIESYKADDRTADRTARTEWWEGKKRTCKDVVDRLNQNLKEYKPTYTFITGLLGGSLFIKYILPLFTKYILPLIIGK